jgi:hypothetical protein
VVVIDFEILPLDRAVSPLWKSSQQVDLAEVSEMDLRYEYFWSRIEFEVKGVDIGKYWGSLPVLDFARSMRFLADSIRDREEVAIGFTEHATIVSFKRIADLVEIRENVFVVPNDGPLDLTGRIVGWGAN